MRGSSPLARGLRHEKRPREGRGGIIPARAGFTLTERCGPHGVGDHPRSRGVYPKVTHFFAPFSGSSPLARGLPGSARAEIPGRWIIPARAGFTPGKGFIKCLPQDHPRSRGVYGRCVLSVPPQNGSSPLARGLPRDEGARLYAPHTRDRAGIIPARAGFTIFGAVTAPSARDHPRSRGVYVFNAAYRPGVAGSSPLARGLRHPDGRGDHQSGIIPARAGFTRRNPGAGRDVADHPRSRGVYLTSGSRRDSPSGSSPLARGLREVAALRAAPSGIIPARAGFTARRVRAPRAGTDHPRSRGVYTWNTVWGAVSGGSSPLARGLLHPCAPILATPGIIPARAGFTWRRRGRRPRPQDHPRSRGVYSASSSLKVPASGSSPLARGLPATPRLPTP